MADRTIENLTGVIENPHVRVEYSGLVYETIQIKNIFFILDGNLIGRGFCSYSPRLVNRQIKIKNALSPFYHKNYFW